MKEGQGAMKLYLAQHGEAAPKEVDPKRGLTPEGARTVDAVAAFLADKALDVPEVWHSGKARAQQTAERLAAGLAAGAKVVSRDGLAPKDDVEAVASALARRDEDLMIVGHLPFLSKLASLLLTGSTKNEVLAFQNAGVFCLQRDGEGARRLAWAVVPALLLP